ncbi:MAG TPA: YciI family protein [Flavobacteriales bacterium]|nr:YciI family protein [Flavobacteriales bacterium]
MRNTLLLLPFLAANTLFAQRTFDVTIADRTCHMKRYGFVMYTRGDGPAMDSLAAERLQQEHLDHQAEQTRCGLIMTAGPFADNSDWRGLLLYDRDTQEEVEGWLRQDPFVKTGRLAYTIHPRYGAIGTTLK